MQHPVGKTNVEIGRLDPAKARALRLAAGYRFVARAADALKVNRKTIQAWESEDRPVRPRLDVLQAFARGYGCTIEDFLVQPAESTPSTALQ